MLNAGEQRLCTCFYKCAITNTTIILKCCFHGMTPQYLIANHAESRNRLWRPLLSLFHWNARADNVVLETNFGGVIQESHQNTPVVAWTTRIFIIALLRVNLVVQPFLLIYCNFWIILNVFSTACVLYFILCYKYMFINIDWCTGPCDYY